MKNNCKDSDVVDYKEKAIIVVFSCLAFNILLLITIAIIYRRRKKHFSSNVYSMEMINLNLENEGIDEEVDVFNTVLPR
jgi:cbb3-type cytochrome oxidase subunit 3